MNQNISINNKKIESKSHIDKKNIIMSNTIKHEFGQYFTTNVILKEIVYKFILNKPSEILEPSIGQGDLVKFVKNKIIRYNF